MPVKLNLPKKEIAIAYKNGMSSNKLAKKYNCAPATIRRNLKEMGVTIRSSAAMPRKNIKQRKREFHEFIRGDRARKVMLIDLIIECIESWKEKRNSNLKGCENNDRT